MAHMEVAKLNTIDLIFGLELKARLPHFGLACQINKTDIIDLVLPPSLWKTRLAIPLLKCKLLGSLFCKLHVFYKKKVYKKMRLKVKVLRN